MLVARGTEQHAARFVGDAIKGAGVETPANNEVRSDEFVVAVGRITPRSGITYRLVHKRRFVGFMPGSRTC